MSGKDTRSEPGKTATVPSEQRENLSPESMAALSELAQLLAEQEAARIVAEAREQAAPRLEPDLSGNSEPPHSGGTHEPD